MRLKSLELSGFRGFASKQRFDLSADAIVVVGQNGFGKTSLLDAIQWCVSGRLKRISDGDDSKLLSMYSKTGEARAELTLIDNEEEIVISRIFDGESQFTRFASEGKDFKGASATSRIVEKLWPEAANSNDGESALASALERSVYLQQDRVRDFLENSTGQERFNVISELVGAGRLTEFQSELEKQSRSWSRSTTELKREQSVLENRVEDLKAQLLALKESSNYGDKLEESQWIKWWQNSQTLGISKNSIPSATSSEASSELDVSLRELQAINNQNERRRLELDELIEFIKTPPPKPNTDLQELQTKLDSASESLRLAKREVKAAQERAAEMRKAQVQIKEAHEQKHALAQLALKLLDQTCPVCEQEYDIEETRNRLEAIVASKETSGRMLIEEDFESLVQKEKEASILEIEIRDKINQEETAHQLYLNWEETCRQKLAEVGIEEIDDAVVKLSQLVEECRLNVENIISQIDKGEKLSLNLARESANAKINSVESDLETAKKNLQIQLAVATKRDLTSIVAKNLIQDLREARSKVAVKKLSQIEPLLQRIFARIDPHPSFRIVKFATDIVRGKGLLDAEVKDIGESKSTKTPETIFSSSQLNALAVSIFLSFNLALPNLPLQVALLDDPIQSLDDINLLGLVDLLRRIKDRRQIVVSTHDKRFGGLLARKLRPGREGQSTSVIELAGWKRTGPEVRQYSVNADIARLRLAKVS